MLVYNTELRLSSIERTLKNFEQRLERLEKSAYGAPGPSDPSDAYRELAKEIRAIKRKIA